MHTTLVIRIACLCFYTVLFCVWLMWTAWWLLRFLLLSPACREVEEELEVVWQAATRGKHNFQESGSPHGSGTLLTSAQSPDLHKRVSFKCDSPQCCNSLDEIKKNGMDFYCWTSDKASNPHLIHNCAKKKKRLLWANEELIVMRFTSTQLNTNQCIF